MGEPVEPRCSHLGVGDEGHSPKAMLVVDDYGCRGDRSGATSVGRRCGRSAVTELVNDDEVEAAEMSAGAAFETAAGLSRRLTRLTSSTKRPRTPARMQVSASSCRIRPACQYPAARCK